MIGEKVKWLCSNYKLTSKYIEYVYCLYIFFYNNKYPLIQLFSYIKMYEHQIFYGFSTN